MASKHKIGDRLSYDGVLCTVRFIGSVADTKGSWLGVEWDDPTRGKHDGQYKGVRYFECTLKSPTSASFIRPTRQDDGKADFLSALHKKYALSEEDLTRKQIVIGTKVAEEVGFDKISRQQGQLDELKIVILDGLRVADAYSSVEDGGEGCHKSIRQICPKVVELDMSRNLFTSFRPIVKICSELDNLRSLKVNGNRFTAFSPADLEGSEMAFKGVKELGLDETLLDWDTITLIASHFPDLTTLWATNNQLTNLSPIPTSRLTTTLTTLNLEYNHFTTLSDLHPLTALTSLRTLHLKGNHISTILPSSSSPTTTPPIFPPTLHYLDLSSNRISTWSFADALPAIFPGLTHLRFAHNPIYDNPDLDNPTPQAVAKEAGTDESYMLLTARLPCLKVINFSSITPQDRTNAEMFYLSRIGRQMAAVPEGEEETVVRRHPRFTELCETYGMPVVRREKEVDGRFLEGRVTSVTFEVVGREEKREVKVPKGFDLYAVKGLVGRLFGVDPLRTRLVWETGEWDPVGGFDEEGGESDDDEREVEDMQVVEDDGEGGPKAGRWVKREVELRDGPRLFGYCVDGQEARIRVEVCG